MHDFDLEGEVRRDVACCRLPNSRLRTGVQLDWRSLHSSFVLLADADDDQPAAVVSHCGDVGSQLALVGIGVSIALALEVEICVLTDRACHEPLQMFLGDLVKASAEELR